MNKNNIYDSFHFTFSGADSRIYITRDIPSLEDLAGGDASNFQKILLVCDEHTLYVAEKISNGTKLPVAVLPPGENFKSWETVETILKKAKDHGLGRDGLFVGIGGGVVTDMAAYAASVYMRGVGVSLVSTSLLGMVDAAAGGKTGFDLFGIKNLIGTFYPAAEIFMPLEVLSTLPNREWKSGLAELIKTAIIGDRKLLDSLSRNPDLIREKTGFLAEVVAKSVRIKCRIVESDPQERGTRRALLNLGHTFGHALESSLGLGTVTHGEAVAWGMARACELGLALGITSQDLSDRIKRILESFDFEIRVPYPGGQDSGIFMDALMNDKKKKNGSLKFVVPDKSGACIVSSDNIPIQLLKEITGNE